MQKTQQSSQPHSLRGVYGCNNRGTENWSTKSSYRNFIFMDGINFYHLNSEELAHGLTRVQFVRKLCSFKVVKRISHIPNDDRHGCPCTAKTDMNSSRVQELILKTRQVIPRWKWKWPFENGCECESPVSVMAVFVNSCQLIVGLY
jgi:hypothetical protein